MIKQFINGCAFKPFNNAVGMCVVIILLVTVLASCKTTKSAYYFKTIQKDTAIAGLMNKDLESKIIKGDKLSIIITSLNREEDPIYNITIPAGGNTAENGYLVSNEGLVSIHKIGNIKAEGLTRKELAKTIQSQLTPYLKDPIVTVQFLNHKVTVMGEVERPQVINMTEEQISVLDALVISGDVKNSAKRDHIMVIREEGNTKKVKILNLEDHSVFTSNWYYLQPNDIVYVIPDEARRQREERRARFQTNFAIVSSAVSLLVILIDRIFR